MLSDMLILSIKSRKRFCTGSQNRKIDFMWEVSETTKGETLDVQMLIEPWSCSTTIYTVSQDRLISALKKLLEIKCWIKKSWTNPKSQICWSTQEGEVLFYFSLKSNISKMPDKSELSKFPKDEKNSFRLPAFTATKKLSINHSNSKTARANFTFCFWSYLDIKSSRPLWLMQACLNTCSLYI